MSSDDRGANAPNEKKIRFRSAAKVLFNPENRIQDLTENDSSEGSAECSKKG